MLRDNIPTELKLEPVPDGEFSAKICVPRQWIGRRILCKVIEEQDTIGDDVFNQDVKPR